MQTITSVQNTKNPCCKHCKRDILAFLFILKSLQRIQAKNRNQRFLFCELLNANESSISSIANYPVRHVCRIATDCARLHSRECKTPQKLIQATLIRLQDSGCHNRECKTPQRHFCTIAALQTWHFGIFVHCEISRKNQFQKEIKWLKNFRIPCCKHCKHDILAFFFNVKSLQSSQAKKRNQRFLFCEHVNANESSITDIMKAGSARLHRNWYKLHW